MKIFYKCWICPNWSKFAHRRIWIWTL